MSNSDEKPPEQITLYRDFLLNECPRFQLLVDTIHSLDERKWLGRDGVWVCNHLSFDKIEKNYTPHVRVTVTFRFINDIEWSHLTETRNYYLPRDDKLYQFSLAMCYPRKNWYDVFGDMSFWREA